MTYRVVFTPTFRKQLKKVRDRKVQRQILKRIRDLDIGAMRYPSLHHGLSGYRRIRVGRYRILYRIIGNEVSVDGLVFRHRYPQS